MSQRRASVAWAVSPQDGDATEAIAEIEAWRSARLRPAPDWERILGHLREALEALCATPRLRNDPEGRRLLQSLAEAGTPEELDATLDRLLARTEALLARDDAAPARKIRLQDLAPQADPRPGGRTILRL